jgi:hypothetical protein
LGSGFSGESFQGQGQGQMAATGRRGGLAGGGAGQPQASPGEIGQQLQADAFTRFGLKPSPFEALG